MNKVERAHRAQDSDISLFSRDVDRKLSRTGRQKRLTKVVEFLSSLPHLIFWGLFQLLVSVNFYYLILLIPIAQHI